MTESIHQTYRNVLNEMHQERLGKSVFQAKIKFPAEDIIYFPRQNSRQGIPNAFGAALGLILGISFWVTGYFLYAKEHPSKPRVPRALAAAPIALEDKSIPSLKAEMELMKKIVSSLAESVETLSEKGRDNKKGTEASLSETFPYPIEVATEKANLRTGANLLATAIGTVAKGTVLLATEEMDKWFKVKSPKGEEAWISKDTVTLKKD